MTKIYSTDHCVQCRATKTAFDRKGLEYVELNTSNNPALAEEAKAYGFLQAPVVVPEVGEPWSGFQPDRISALAA